MKNVFLHTLYAVAMAAIVSSCVEAVQEDAPAELLTPSISVGQSTSGDSFTVEWTSVPNAVSYAYSLNGASEVSTAELSVTFQDMEPGSYNVRVKALAPDGGAYLDSQWGSCDFELVAGAGADSDQERLGKPELKAENVTWDSFSVSWSAVEGAGEYVYSLNGGEEITTSATEVEFTGLEAGDYRVRVKATEGGAMADSYWAAITVTVYSQDEDFSLDKPVLRVENQTETSFTVAWNVVENASYYMYRLSGGDPVQTYNTSVDFTDCTPGDYTVEVKAVPAEGTVYKDSEWASITVILEDPAAPEDNKLATPELEVTTGSMSFVVEWNSVENAETYVYTLMVNGTDGEKTDTEGSTRIEFSDMQEGEYVIRVQAKAAEDSEYIDSGWAEESFTLNGTQDGIPLEIPNLSVTYLEGHDIRAYWNPVANAERYVYRIDGEGENEVHGFDFDRDLNEYFILLGFGYPGNYLLEVRALAEEGSGYVDSEWASYNVTFLDFRGTYTFTSEEGSSNYTIYYEPSDSKYFIQTDFAQDPFVARRIGDTLKVSVNPVQVDVGVEYGGIVDVVLCAYHTDSEDGQLYLWPDEESVWSFDESGVTLVNGLFIGFEDVIDNEGWYSWQNSKILPGTRISKNSSSSAPAAVLSAPGAVKPSVLHNVAR